MVKIPNEKQAQKTNRTVSKGVSIGMLAGTVAGVGFSLVSGKSMGFAGLGMAVGALLGLVIGEMTVKRRSRELPETELPDK